jgi:hypothetical protein
MDRTVISPAEGRRVMGFAQNRVGKRRGLSAAALACAVLVFGAPAGSTATGIEGWKVVEFPGIAPTRFVSAADGGIDVQSDNSSAVMYRTLGPEEAGRRYLTWRWRVDKAPPPTDLTRRDGDRPLAIHLCFKMKGRKAGFMDWVTSAVGPDVEGFGWDHRCLTYIWGGQSAAGRMFPNPHMKDRGVMVILRGVGAPTGEWFTEKIDSAKDYRAAFGEEAPKPSVIAISGDSDGTESIADGTIAALTFSDN